jgi:hypothetical protein
MQQIMSGFSPCGKYMEGGGGFNPYIMPLTIMLQKQREVKTK